MSSSGVPSPSREATPSSFTPPLSSIPQKRSLEDDHQPAVSSPLNPDFKAAKPKPEPQDDAPFARDRAPRTKKESLKKRESNVRSNLPESARATPDPRAASAPKKRTEVVVVTPQRFKLPPPKLSDFDAPREPPFIPSHTKTTIEGAVIQFNETSEQ